MLDFADVVAINKFERRGAEDARRDVARQLRPQPRARSARPGRTCRSSARARRASTTTASPRSTSTCAPCSREQGLPEFDGALRGRDRAARRRSSTSLLPRGRERYLAEIAETVRGYHARDRGGRPRSPDAASTLRRHARAARRRGRARRGRRRSPPLADVGRVGARSRATRRPLEAWPRRAGVYDGDEQVYVVRGKEVHTPLTAHDAVGIAACRAWRSPATTTTRPCALPPLREPAGLVPVHRGRLPVQARGRGTRRACSPARATRRVRTAASTCCPRGSRRPGCRRRSTRSRSTAATPTPRPDIYGKVGTSGVSVATARRHQATSTPASTCARRRRRCR